jgi:hypothetical protein
MRELREKLSLGLNTYAFGAELLLSVQSVVEPHESNADTAAEMRFAEDAAGNGYVVNLDDGRVAFIDGATGHRLNLGADLRGFVEALGPNQVPWR